MYRLTREIRFAVEANPLRGANSYAGQPSVAGFGPFLALQVTVAGSPDPKSSYLRNIVDIDRQTRERAIPVISRGVRDGRPPALALLDCGIALMDAWPGCTLAAIALCVSPYQSFSIRFDQNPMEHVMVRLSQRFEFSAAHRLHNPALSADENLQIFGKCNNPHGHGHNYQVQVTLLGEPDAQGQLIPLAEFEGVVMKHAIDRLDHKHLNIEVPAFTETNPSVEYIARVIYEWLKAPLQREQSRLASVTVWETPKTWAEYDES